MVQRRKTKKHLKTKISRLTKKSVATLHGRSFFVSCRMEETVFAWTVLIGRCFTKTLKVVAAFLRRQGMRLIEYLHDILKTTISKERIKADVFWGVEWLQSLGFLIN